MIFTSASLLQAMLKVAATFMFTGNLRTAALAFPSYNTVSLSTEIPSDLGGFRVIRLTSVILPMEAALIPSKPTMAPEGVYILDLFSIAIVSRWFLNSGSIKAPTLMITTFFPLLRIRGIISTTAWGDAASITRSTWFNMSLISWTAIPSVLDANFLALLISQS
ncbi:MAG: hypothetical protein A4E25_02188 [Methanobacterium sp. PtaB.Bin024]|nr:MAG: hypothetical protein A4E25_02188 [Methanobacterium sp. PtaB.Bin024]